MISARFLLLIDLNPGVHVRRCLFLFFVISLTGWQVESAHAAVYRMPVDGVLVDSFRPPVTPYGAGNRGWELDVGGRTDVVAPADGMVVFAGQVGGVLNIVIQHADGVRTTLRKLHSIDVTKGDVVHAGQRVGVASNQFYFGARCGDAYIDPAKLFNRRVRLVSLDGVDGEVTTAFSCHAQMVTAAQQEWMAAASLPQIVHETLRSLR